MTSTSRAGLRLAACLAGMLTCAPAHAAVFLVTDLASLYPSDSLAWTDPEFTMYGPGDTPGGTTATLGGASAFTVFSGSTYSTNFLPTDSVLSAFDLNTGEVAGPIGIGFGQLFAGAGAQIQSFLIGPFTATLRAFDSSNTLLGSVTITGVTGQLGDGSAPFIGIRSDGLDIARVEFDAGPGMAIGTVGLSVTPVPEPATLSLLAAGLGLVTLARRRRRAA